MKRSREIAHISYICNLPSELIRKLVIVAPGLGLVATDLYRIRCDNLSEVVGNTLQYTVSGEPRAGFADAFTRAFKLENIDVDYNVCAFIRTLCACKPPMLTVRCGSRILLQLDGLVAPCSGIDKITFDMIMLRKYDLWNNREVEIYVKDFTTSSLIPRDILEAVADAPSTLRVYRGRKPFPFVDPLAATMTSRTLEHKYRSRMIRFATICDPDNFLRMSVRGSLKQ